MLSQFSPEGERLTLASLFDFPKDIYPVGRLDAESEGLLLLTNDKEINHRLLNPKFKHRRTYLTQLDGDITPEAVQLLSKGVTISVDSKPHKTMPAAVKKFTGEPDLPERNKPIRFRKNIPTSWIEITLYEGKNHQVRKMTAAVGFPTLRLVRISIEGITLGNMQPGEIICLEKSQVYNLLFKNNLL